MKRTYRCELSCLSVPFSSLFLLLLANVEVQAEEKRKIIPDFNEINNQLADDIFPISAIANKAAIEPNILVAQIDLGSEILARPRQFLQAGFLRQRTISQNTITPVTGVKLKQTNKGLEVILTTAAGSQKLVPLILPEGNKLVIDILDATLALPTENEFTQVNPASGIRSVALTKIDSSSIRW
jgi:hypothetical protein